MNTRRLPALALVLLSVALPTLSGSACTTQAYCFVCDTPPGDSGGTGSGASGGTGGLIIDGGLRGGRGGGGGVIVLPDGGLGGEGGDPNCTADTQNDPNNCGSCGNRCSLLGAFAKCEKGQCLVDRCSEGFRDLNGIQADGCEYKCPVFPIQEETCNGLDDNCDGVKDDGIDLKSLENCGSCGNKCQVAKGTPKCAELVPGFFQCAVDKCDDGFVDIDKVPSNGCEYKCPVWPAKAEVCNDLDDDCDGVVNNGNPGGGAACSDTCPNGTCLGECLPGQRFCIGPQLICVGGEGPKAERCDGKDNDCDGVNDNGFDLTTDPLNCGACGRSCNVSHAIAKCTSSACIIESCEPGWRDLNNNANDGCEHPCEQYPTSDEICDGKDNNCNGQADEGLTPPPNYCRQTGPCAGAVAGCQGALGWRCNYKQRDLRIEVLSDGSISPAETLCDDFDNNCDGNTDETFPNKGRACSAGTGVCRGTGVYRCTADHLNVECPAVATPGAATDEACNGLDDNCDGQVDERVPIVSTDCGGRACVGFSDPMVDLGTGVWVYQYEASHPDATVSEAGANTTRACSKPGVLPWSSSTQAEAAAACAAVLDSMGAPLRLCTESEWAFACNAGQGGTRWSFSANSTTYTAGVCNDGNSGRNPAGPWETAHNNGGGALCRAALGSGIYDMSGNVAEWTSTSVTVNSNTYYRVRGGGYQSLGPAAACNFSFVLQRPEYANYDLGFRCCAEHAP